jgi:NodT family efflux transporter outer membrane factor (OMF) lipoprotein
MQLSIKNSIYAFAPCLCLSLLLSACAITSIPAPAPDPAPAQFKEAAPMPATPSALVPDSWWTVFKDPVLDDLERRVLIGNESLKTSLAQIANVRATLDASYSARQPTLSAGLAATRSGNVSGSNTTSSGGSTTNTQNPANNVALTATAGWELDVWGRLSQAVQGAQANVQASQSDLAAATLSVQSTLAQTYFSMRTAEAQKALLETSVQAYEKSLQLTQARRSGGMATLSDELQARTQLNTAQAQLADITAQRAQFEHAIAVLLGVPPSSLTIPANATLPEAVDVPQILPSALLQRRPDIAAAQSRVRAAYAQIGVTDAAMFPTVSLSANLGYSQDSLANLLNAPNLLWTLGASLTQSVLDGGVRTQARAQARAAADLATSNYRQLVLTSLQEVEDNLVLAAQLKREVQWQQQALEAARKNLEITLDQYRFGTVSYLNVTTAQTAAFSAESTWLTVRNRELAAQNVLLKNVAGRWDLVAVN